MSFPPIQAQAPGAPPATESPPPRAGGDGVAAPGQVQTTQHFLELLDQVKAEFLGVSAQASRAAADSSSADHKIIQQHMNELLKVRKTIFDLDQAHRQMRDRYDAELAKLREKLDKYNPQPAVITQSGDDAAGTLAPPDEERAAAQAGTRPESRASSQPSAVAGAAAAAGGAGASSDGKSSSPATRTPVTPAATTALATPAPLQPPAVLPPVEPAAAVASAPAVQAPQPVPPQLKQEPVRAPGAPQEQDGVPFPSLVMLDAASVPPEFVEEKESFTVVYNPERARTLDLELVHTFPHHSVACCVRFSDDGALVATGSNRAAHVFSVSTGELVCRLQDPSVSDHSDMYMRSLCFSPDGRLLASGAEDHRVRLWDIHTQKIQHVFSGHSLDVHSVAFSSDGRFIVSGSGDHQIKMWDVQSGECVREWRIPDGVTSVALRSDDRRVVAGSLDRIIRVWDIERNRMVECLSSPEGHEDSVYSVAYRPGNKELVSGSLDCTIKIWTLSPDSEAMRGRVRTTLRGHIDFVLSVAVTPDAKHIVSGSKDRTVQIWDADTGEAELVLRAHNNSVISVAVAQHGNLFASGSGDFAVKIWRYRSRE